MLDEGRHVQFGLSRRWERRALEDGDGGESAVGLEFRLLDGQLPVELCFCEELAAETSVGEEDSVTAADVPRYGASEWDVGAVRGVHPIVAGGWQGAQCVKEEAESCVFDARPSAVLDKIEQDRGGRVGGREHHAGVATDEAATGEEGCRVTCLVGGGGNRQPPQRVGYALRIIGRVGRRVGYRGPVHGVDGIQGHTRILPECGTGTGSAAEMTSGLHTLDPGRLRTPL
ncbi:hypothetical protein ACFQ5X_00590 [Streptomyces kaempferi]|uniref:Uncharacterized protein n=1 Tax=Streptomyces kaempferi TaxID=333725 RepID=A0ABW3X4G5_9ACTN